MASITSLLSSPSKVAHALDWRKASGSILSLVFKRDRIDLAVSSHPAFGQPLLPLASIPIMESKAAIQQPAVAQELAQTVHDFSVCGLLVGWPVQPEGRCGAPCGRVLFQLDQLAAQNNKTYSSRSVIFSPSRPMCLWDERHYAPPEDEWGRAAIHSRATEQQQPHSARREQYGERATVPAEIWNDFCRVHWPELYQKEYHRTTSVRHAEEAYHPWLHTIQEEGMSLNQALL
jgi:hypothetical protein